MWIHVLSYFVVCFLLSFSQILNIKSAWPTLDMISAYTHAQFWELYMCKIIYIHTYMCINIYKKSIKALL